MYIFIWRNTDISLNVDQHWFYPSSIWHLRPSLTQRTHFKSHLLGFFLVGALLVKYDNHKTGCAASSYKYFICFQQAVNMFQTTTTGSLIQSTGRSGHGLAAYGPCRDPSASERLLSAWSVLINIPSSRVMINANLIDCVSEEKPSQSEWSRARVSWPIAVLLRLNTKQQRSLPTVLYESGPTHVEGDRCWCFRVGDTLPESKANSPEIMNRKKERGKTRSTVSEAVVQMSVYQRDWNLAAVLGFLISDWHLLNAQGSTSRHFMWRRAEPLGAGPHRPCMAGLRGCSQPSLGAWPFQVIDRRSKRHFLRGDLWRCGQSRSLFRP